MCIIYQITHGVTLKSPYIWKWNIQGIKHRNIKRMVCWEPKSKRILRSFWYFLSYSHSNFGGKKTLKKYFFPILNCPYWHVMQQRLKSADFTDVLKSSRKQIKHFSWGIFWNVGLTELPNTEFKINQLSRN